VLGGGTGIRGWLRSIYEKLTGTIAVSGSLTVTGGATEAKQDTQISLLDDINVESGSTNTILLGQQVDTGVPVSPLAVGILSMTVRKDVATPLADLDGKAAPVQTDTSGNLRVVASGAATETTLAALLAKVIAAPATEAEQVLAKALLTTLTDATGQTSSPASATARGQLVQSVRKDIATALADADADYAPLQTDSSGRLRVIAANARKPISTAAWVGTGANNLSIACDDFSSAVFSIRGTYATFTVLFEVSHDNTNWLGMPAYRRDTRALIAVAGAATGANASASYSVSCDGFQFVRIRTAAGPSTGTANVTLNLSSLPAVTDVLATINGTVSGSGTFTTSLASTVANQGTAGGLGNSDSTANLGIGATFTGTTRDLGATLGVYSEVVAHFFADQVSGANGAQIQFSTDNFATNWVAISTTLVSNVATTIRVPAVARYFRIVLVNGGVAQTFNRIASLAKRN
jgi:hypothetical protein